MSLLCLKRIRTPPNVVPPVRTGADQELRGWAVAKQTDPEFTESAMQAFPMLPLKDLLIVMELIVISIKNGAH